MILKSSKREITLEFKSMKMEKFGDRFGGDTEFLLRTKASEGNINMLTTLIRHFAVESLTEVAAHDIIDELQDDGQKIAYIYNEIFKGINERGFFAQPLVVLEAPPINMKLLQKEMFEKMSQEIGTQVMKEQVGEITSAASGQLLTSAG